jgi:cell division septation protein DedD
MVTELHEENNVTFVPEFVDDAPRVFTVEDNAKKAVEAPQEQHREIEEMRKSVCDLPNVVDAVPNPGNHMDTNGKGVASAVEELRPTERKQETEDKDHEEEAIEFVGG